MKCAMAAIALQTASGYSIVPGVRQASVAGRVSSYEIWLRVTNESDCAPRRIFEPGDLCYSTPVR